MGRGIHTLWMPSLFGYSQQKFSGIKNTPFGVFFHQIQTITFAFNAFFVYEAFMYLTPVANNINIVIAVKMGCIQYDKAIEIWHKIAKYNESENPSLEIELYKKMLNIFHVSDFYYFIFNCPTAQIEWASNSITKVLGLASAKDFTIEFILSHIHPDDLPYFIDFENKVTAFFNQLPPEKVLKYKVNYDYRIRRPDGKYIRILQQAITIQTNENGAVLRVLDVHTDISHLKKESGSTLSFIGLDGEPSYNNFATSNEPTATKDKLTNKEKEILNLLSAGKTSTEVADTLFISKHTVDTHRKNMLKKTKSRSMIELMMTCMNNN